MNYIKELNAFRDWMLLNDLPTGGIALWHTLMSVNNMTGWKERFNAPNSTVEKLTGLSKQGLVDARKRLIENGLIEYEKGSKNKAPIYKMISLVKFMDDKLDSSSYQSEYQSTYQSHTDDLTIPKHKQNETKQNETKEQQPTAPSMADILRDPEFASLVKYYKANIGEPTAAIRDELGALSDMSSPVLVELALKEAILAQAHNKLGYALRVLENWVSRNIKTAEDVERMKSQRSRSSNGRGNVQSLFEPSQETLKRQKAKAQKYSGAQADYSHMPF